jgi:hypothetical protein
MRILFNRGWGRIDSSVQARALLQPAQQFWHRGSNTPCDDLQRDDSDLTLVLLNVRYVSTVPHACRPHAPELGQVSVQGLRQIIPEPAGN